jgi:hypothetical protein
MSAEKTLIHRIPYTDLSNDSAPEAFVLAVSSGDHAEAYQLASEISDFDKLPEGVSKRYLKFEEALPILRQGFALRRRAWKKDKVIRLGSHLSISECYRDIHSPSSRHTFVCSWPNGDSSPAADLLSDDWEVAPTPFRIVP